MMRPPAGCVIVGERGAALLGADGWYHEKFFDVFLPRILAAEKMGDLYILVPLPICAIEGFRVLPPRCHVIPCRDEAIGESLSTIAAGGHDAVLFIHPCHLLVSPAEIDRLIVFHENSGHAHCANNRPMDRNNYPTGIGAEIVPAGFLRSIPASAVPHSWDETNPWITGAGHADGPRAPPECAGPEITITCSSAEERTKLRTLISALEQSEPGPLWDVPRILQTYRTHNQVRTAIILEDDADIERAVTWAQKAGGETLFISLHPYCSYALDKRTIRHRTMIDYYDPDLFHTIGRDNFGRVRRFCADVDRYLSPQEHAWQAPASFASYPLKILFDVTILKAHTIHNVIRKEQPDAIVIFSTQPKGPHAPPLPYSYEDPVYGMIAILPEWHIPVMDFSAGAPAPLPQHAGNHGADLSRSAKQLLRTKSPLLFNAGVILKNRGITSLIAAGLSALRGAHTVLIYESGYNWDDALPELYGAGVREIQRVFDTSLGSGSAEWVADQPIIQACARALPGAGLDTISPIDLTALIIPRCVHIIAYAKQEAQATYEQVQVLLTDKKVRCLLLATRSSPKGNAVVRAARDHGIPVVSWQHGAAGLMDHPIMVQVELRGSTTHLVFGKGVAVNYTRMLQVCAERDPPGIVPLGSSSLDRIAYAVSRTQSQSPKKTVLYVTTSYLINVWYISFARGEFDESLRQVQQSLLQVFARHPEYDFIVKLHPSHSNRKPLAGYVADLKVPNIRLVVQEEPIEDLYRTADVIILDLISTSTLQACTTEKPIIAYTGLYQYDALVTDLLAKRAAVYSDPFDFINGVQQALRGEFPAGTDLRNTEFLTCFGTFQNDSRAAERAAAVVRGVLPPSE